MAVVTVNEIPKGTGGSQSDQGHRQRDRVFQVLVDSPYDGSVTVENAAGIPTIGTTYTNASGEFDNGIVLVQKESHRSDRHRLLWEVTCSYSSEYQNLTRILSEPPEIEYTTETATEPILGQPATNYDPRNAVAPQQTGWTDGQQIFLSEGKGSVRNSAGQLFDPPPTRRVSVPIVRFTRNEASFSVANKVYYENSVNANPWNGLQARQAFCREMSAQVLYFCPPTVNLMRLVYNRVTYTFALKDITWDLWMLDCGPFYLDYTGVATGVAKSFKNPDGTPRIGLLDHKTDSAKPGQQLTVTGTNPGIAQYLRWRVYREVDYSALGIDLNLAITAVRSRARGFSPTPDPSKTPIQVAT